MRRFGCGGYVSVQIGDPGSGMTENFAGLCSAWTGESPVFTQFLLDYFAALKVMGTSALSASSTLNMGRGVRLMKLATNVSGIC